MKKKTALFIFVALLISKTFAGEYVYWEKHVRPRSGVEYHGKLCLPKKYADAISADIAFQEDIDNMLRSTTLNPGQTLTFYVTSITLPNGYIYKVIFVWDSSPTGNLGMVTTYKYNYLTDDDSESIGEAIYQISHPLFNYLYEIYQDQCNKYLNMY